jgi:hypothetical protein
MKTLPKSAGFTVVELLCASALSLVVLAGASAGVVALQKSFKGSQQYATGMNDGTRIIDYISRDLRNAVKISRVQTGVATAFKTGSLDVTGLDQLSISVPDYYASNTPMNTAGSPYKSPRFSRATLPTGSTYFPYTQVVNVVGTTRVPKYPGLVEVRYVKKVRSPQDPTMCYFRREYTGGAAMVLSSDAEVAENVSTQTLTVSALDPKRFRIITNFRPKWSGEARRAGTQQIATVKVLNMRMD